MADGDTYQHGVVDNDPVVTVTVGAGARRVRVINMTGTTKLAFTVNGTAPSMSGNNRVLPARAGANAVVDMEGGGTAVKLLGEAAGTDYSVWVAG